MRKLCTLAVVCTVLPGLAGLGLAQDKPGAAPQGTNGIADVLRTAVEKNRVPGVVAIVVTLDGVAYRGAFGTSPDGIFAIASMTKPITSLAVMQLVEAGKVKLDEPASTYLPELAAIQVLENGALRPPKSKLTVRQLLAHTSGFVYEPFNRDLFAYASQGHVPRMMAGGDGYLQAPLLFDPGSRWEYGISTDWLGRLVERVSGQTLEAYFRRAIFDPLQMNDTFFNVPPEKQSRLVRTHVRGADGSLAAAPPRPLEPVTFFSGGGGLHSTADDYLKFVQAIMGGGQRGGVHILKGELVEEMARNQIGEHRLYPLPSLIPGLTKEGATLPGRPDKFGLGFGLNSGPLPGTRGANTLSWGGVQNTFFWIDREKKVSAILLMQMLPFLEDGPQEVVNDFERAVYAWRDARHD